MDEILERNEDITIGTTALIISEGQLNNNAVREVITIQNNSSGGQTTRVSIGKQATTTTGTNLSPGGSITDSMDSGYLPSQSRITAIASAAGGTLTIYERIRIKR